MHQHEKLNYVEFPSSNISATKLFFEKAFAWQFQDYGPDYAAFANEGLDGGFFKADLASTTKTGAALLVFFSKDLEATQLKVIQAGGRMLKEIYDFPGGRRFHFCEPSGNEFAVWAEPK